MSISRSYTSRALLGVLVLSLFWLALYVMAARRISSPGASSSIDRSSPPASARDAFAATPEALAAAASLKRTAVADLPGLPQTQSAPRLWDLVDGLNAVVIEGSSPAAGQKVLRLTALDGEERHAISARFTDLSPGALYRVTVWLKVHPSQRIMVEARDSVVANTGKASHYGIAHFDMNTGAVLRASGDLKGQGIAQPRDDWMALWCDLYTKDGQVYVLLGFLESPRNQHIFKGAGQELVMGGFEIARR